MFQRGRKVKEGRRWLMNLRVTTLAHTGIRSMDEPLHAFLPLYRAIPDGVTR